MSNEINPKKYRIKEFAHYVGVTPDFLKHYEDSHLLSASRSESGYRYFSFTQTSLILASIGMRSYGVTVRQMEEFFKDLDGEETISQFDEHAKTIEKRMQHDASVLENHKAFKNWLAMRQGQTPDWEVRESPGFYFLPHSNGLKFLEDERIYTLLPEWNAWIPVVKSAARIGTTKGPVEDEDNLCWGLSVLESDVEKYGIPITDVVEYVPPTKAFLYHCTNIVRRDLLALRKDRIHPLYDVMKELGLKSQEKMFFTVLQSAQIANLQKGRFYGTFVVPLA